MGKIYKKIIFIFIFLLITNLAQSQTKITQTEKLATTAKVWGFLKYYHPNVAKGKFNWDEQLFSILPKIEATDSKNELSALLLNWIDTLGEVKICKSCKNKDEVKYFNKNFDLSWTQNLKLFNPKLSEKLKYIEENRFQGKHHYVYLKKGIRAAKNIYIQNETSYENFNWEVKNLRLLSLFRYWNTIEYFFPYKYQTDQPWNDILIEMLPKFLSPQSELDYHLAMLELVVKIDDSHAGLQSDLLNEHFGNKHIPALYKIIDDKAVITRMLNDSIAQLNDLKIGDVISKVNGENVMDIFNKNCDYIQGSNYPSKLSFAWNKIFNGTSDSLTIEFLRNNELNTKKIRRYLFEDFNYKKSKKEKWKIINSNIGYVSMGELERDDVSAMMDSLMQTKAMIFDIRNYPKGTLYNIANYLNSKPKEFFKVINPDLSYPGKFIWVKGLTCGGDGKVKERYKGKVVLLVNSYTQSHAEFTTMCLQTAEDVITIGNQTSGADGNVSSISLIGGFKTGISGIGIFYPDKTKTQRKGVKIDIELQPTIEGIRNGDDEILDKAIEIINSKI